jgi:putative ABC transport system permease protein
MLANYFKVALRSIFRNKLTAFINILGLAIAMACALIIYLFVHDELRYDRYNEHADRTFRVTRNFISPDGSVMLHLGHVAPPFGPLLKNDFDDFEYVVRTLQSRLTITYEENAEEKKSSYENNSFFAEPELLKVFSLSVLQGNSDKVLIDPFTVMLSEKTAYKYFGDESAIGRTLRVGGRYDITVNGIFKDFPAQSHWHPELLISFSTLSDTTLYGKRALETNYGNNSFGTYALVKESTDISAIERAFPAFLDKHIPKGNGPNPVNPSKQSNLFLQKLTDIHLRSQLDSEVETNGNIKNVYMMEIIGVFIVLIACFNFINLSTARATKRSKEVGLRKVVGAIKKQLIFQYLSESVLIACFSLVLSIALIFISIGWLNDFTSKSVDLNVISNWPLFMGMTVFALLIGILAGIYPAFVISGFNPAMILKGHHGSMSGKSGLRKSLVVAQFAISIILIISTAITFQQLQYLNNQDLGYNKDQVVTLKFFNELTPQYDAFYNELVKQSTIQHVSRSSRTPTGRLLDSNGTALVQKGDSMINTNLALKSIYTDQSFFDTYEVSLVAGRNFSKDIKSDDSIAFIINESAAKMMGVTPEEILALNVQYGGVKGRVIGVVEDFHFESLHEEIVPIIFLPNKFFNQISIQVGSDQMSTALQHIEKVWREFLPNRPFEYSFLSEQYKRLYDSEQKQGKLFSIFSGLAIFIACLGLFGLATFNTLQRVKEIGIRKVLGASVPQILGILSREIIILVLAANVIAWPVAWYFMDQWLGSFAYRIELGIGVFLLSTGGALLVAILTVSSQTIKAAMTDPADTLRYE